MFVYLVTAPEVGSRTSTVNFVSNPGTFRSSSQDGERVQRDIRIGDGVVDGHEIGELDAVNGDKPRDPFWERPKE